MWPFSKKNKIGSPFPPTEELLRFPKPSKMDQEVSVDELKQAVGVEPRPSKPPEKDISEKKNKIKKEMPEEMDLSEPISNRAEIITRERFVRMNNYQQLLNNLDKIQESNLDLEKFTGKLSESKFNENKNYEKLKRELKRVHDRLLAMDEIIFKK